MATFGMEPGTLPGGPGWFAPGIQPPEYIPGGPSAIPAAQTPVAGVVQAGLPLAILAGTAAGLIGGLLADGGGGPGVELPAAAYRAGMVATGGNGMAGTGLMSVGGVPVSGPGVPEPPRALVAKQWKTKAFSYTAGEYWVYFFKLIDGRIMCYNGAKREWKIWRPRKPIVLYRGKVTLSQAVRTQRMLDRLWRTVAKRTKALKLA